MLLASYTKMDVSMNSRSLMLKLIWKKVAEGLMNKITKKYNFYKKNSVEWFLEKLVEI